MRKVATAIVGIVLFIVTGNVPANAMLPPERVNSNNVDTCPDETFVHGEYTIKCDDDYPCEVLEVLTYSGECYWTSRNYNR